VLINKSTSKTLFATSIAALLAVSSSQAFAEKELQTPRIYVDPETGATTEIVKLPSEMTIEEMSSYSVEDLERLKAIEAKLKEQAERSN